ncbi:MAG: hypothetical protein LRZ91_04365 [Desulfotomaculum sp.]|nr:hypothetical protein [Desulfotomaculum sp.]
MALKEKYGSEVVFIIADLRKSEAQQLAGDFNIRGIPVCYFINKDGEVVFEKAGVVSFEEMERIILEKLLNEE